MSKWMASSMVNGNSIDTSDFYAFLIQSDIAHEEADYAELLFFNFPKLLAHHSYVFRIILRWVFTKAVS